MRGNPGVKKSEEHRRKISEAKKGKPSPGKGKKHTEESKQNMSFGKIGIRLNPEQRAVRKRQKTTAWMKANPERVAGYDLKALKPRALANSARRRKLRTEGIIKLGGRCSSPTCGWINNDGSHGCTDFRALQFDHVKGGGTQERKITSYYEGLCKDVISDITGKYQLLCANCNWIKAFEKREFLYKYEMEKSS